jgi:hypothetical protein
MLPAMTAKAGAAIRLSFNGAVQRLIADSEIQITVRKDVE